MQVSPGVLERLLVCARLGKFYVDSDRAKFVGAGLLTPDSFTLTDAAKRILREARMLAP